MNISMSWLREWANPQISDEALSEGLTMAGLEVDSIMPVAPAFEKVVVGRVVRCEKHPNADKLNLCQVDIAENQNLQIICGADNVRENLNVSVATVGAKLPGGLKIKKAKIRGLESFGMICSAAELGMAESSDGISELDADATIGQNIREYLDLDDNIIELDITPNRGDCFCILGVAREVCANYNLTLNMPSYSVAPNIDKKIHTNVSNTKACPKYLTRIIKAVDNSVSTPQWMARKLARSGQQQHSPVVDITNYVLLELGQPMHAFDLSKISGNISVRMANNGEAVELLNQQNVELKDNTLVIADDTKVLAIAGVMGGADSATQPDTTDILLESAFFEPTAIAGKARLYGLHTESSLRFERGVDFNMAELAMQRATQLVLEICGGQASVINKCIDESALPQLKPISISKAKIKKVLGFELDANWIEQKFNGLNFAISAKSNESWSIMPPSFRFDIRIHEDLIEELARLYGYDKLPLQKLAFDANINTTSPDKIAAYDLAQVLVNRGYQEVINYSFIAQQYQDLIDADAQKITLKNPISADMSIMRSSLWAGLLQTVESNQRRGHNNARFFELGLCFAGLKANQQIQKIAGIISGNRYHQQWSGEAQAVDFYDIKSDVESLLLLSGKVAEFELAQHPALQQGQTAKILLDGKQIGWVGTLSPIAQQQLSLAKCYLFELDLASLQQGSIAQYQPFSAYQKTTRDIALIVDENIPAADLISSIKSLAQNYLVDINLFDVYIGDNIGVGKKSLALNLIYQSNSATLSDEQVEQQVEQVLTLMQTQFSATQRV